MDLAPCGPRDALVEVHACGICGSDLTYIRLGGLAGPGGAPMPLGHEFAGVVRQVGAEVAGLAPGQRVVVHPGNDVLGRIGGAAPSAAWPMWCWSGRPRPEDGSSGFPTAWRWMSRP
ncbi:alcohol dehydrogenase catalytic domain-containing protein [Mycobacterium persicum]|uniref:alcohol dehydrogenase catalytic domain-containing protein n=1 Tax=Mycobacterium persicum TaxID=1487726 RepID=UPI0016050CE8|nr:alcohol dehydrogenase catalytic domain-containing protein [Mycobacterium persicum]